MPIPLLTFVFDNGIDNIPYLVRILQSCAALALLWLFRTYFGGARNTAERNMHSKVVMMTGGTSGIGAAVARGLAERGAQLVLLTQHALSDPFLEDFILDLRTQTNNELIRAEQVDLSSLHSIRQFATKWVDNAPPRRLDMIILCANTMTPKGNAVAVSKDGVEAHFALNYLCNFHLLSILSPALRAQPPDRDVRIMLGTCSSYMGGQLPEKVPVPNLPGSSNSKKLKSTDNPMIAANPSAAYASSKLALMTFAAAFQKHLSTYARPDKAPMNSRVILVDPGWTRTPGMRRYLTQGSLWGLGLYLLTWPLWWLLLKSPEQGAQTFLHAAMEAHYGIGEGGKLLKECREIKVSKDEVKDEARQKELWEMSEKAIEALEKQAATQRAAEKKAEEDEKQDKAREERVKENAQKKEGSRRSRKVANA